MNFVDIIILFVVVLIIGLITFFQFIFPKIKHKQVSPCTKCSYAKNCGAQLKCGEQESKLNKQKSIKTLKRKSKN